MADKDTLFKAGGEGPGSFVFDEKVVRVFPDMISRSVPGYDLVVPMTGLLARRYAREGTNIYDLGCSLGATTLAMRSAIRAVGTRIIAIDNSPAMVERCTEILAGQGGDIPVEVLLADVCDVAIENASVVVLNFTLQFVDPPNRLPLLRRIAAGLHPGGVLVLSEKVRFDDESEQGRQTDWYHDYKKAKGYSDLEIAAKRSALEKVLQSDTEAEHIERLEQAGFERASRWFQCFNFASYVAFAPHRE